MPQIPSTALVEKAVHTIRMLSADGVEKANSGHPGMPMGMADMAFVLWTRHLRFDPGDPRWLDRDRFVLSAGHGSMLLYSLLHLAGYDLSLEDLKNSASWDSRTPGHPEYGHTAGRRDHDRPARPGLRQRRSAWRSARMLAARSARAFPSGHWVFAIFCDGDLMEGVSAEAASLAGHLGLGQPGLPLRRQPHHHRGRHRLAFPAKT